MSAQSKLKAESRWHQKIFAVISAATAVPQSKAALSSPACIVEPGVSQDFLEIHLVFFLCDFSLLLPRAQSTVTLLRKKIDFFFPSSSFERDTALCGSG